MRKKVEDGTHLNQISKVSNLIFNLIFILCSLACIIPILFVVIISFTSEQSIAQNGYSFWPSEWTLEAYIYLIQMKGQIFTSYLISIIITIIGTVIGIYLNATMGYVVSRKNFAFNKLFTFMILIPMFLNGGMISLYLVVVKFLGIKDTLLALILPLAVSSFYIIIFRTFFKTTIPDSIIESATMDGAGQMRIFWSIVVPISKPALATIGLFLTFAYWNDWFNALLFIDSPELVPIQALLMRIEKNIEFLQQNVHMAGSSASEIIARVPKESVKMAIVVLTALPIACSYPFFQKYFVSGLTIGAVKE